MRIPKMQASPQYRVTVPALDGGVNLKEAPNLVGDNQLTDARNVWWKDQALRTRPGLLTDEGKQWYIGGTDMTDYFRYKSYPPVQIEESGNTYTYFPFLYENEGSRKTCYFIVYCIDEDYNRVDTSSVVFDFGDGASSYATDAFVFVGRKTDSSNGFYVFFNNGQIYRMDTSRELIQVPESEYYVPLVTVNGRGADSDLYNPDAPNGTLFEGYNMLTAAFRAGFTADGKGSRLVLPLKDLDAGKPISISYIRGDYGAYWTIPANATESPSVTVNLDFSGAGEFENRDVKFTIDRIDGVLQTWVTSSDPEVSGSQDWVKAGLPSSGTNNDILVTAYGPQTGKPLIFDMRFSAWFGGDRSGINGGTRLFVSGCSSRPNLVHWSDVDNPLYFPENNYAYVGDSSQAATAFGKQSDMLVIFKSREMYYATYVAGGDFTAQDVIDGKIVDVTAYMAKFPITQINGEIGCDCPRTVQLCNNRLAWATSDGRVYTLTSATPYSERNVRELSGMIHKRLSSQTASALKEAVSCDYDGHYMLIVGKDAYLLDYNTSGYEYNTSYTSGNAERHMPWHIWRLSEELAWPAVVARQEKIWLMGLKVRKWTDSLGASMKSAQGMSYTLAGNVDYMPGLFDNSAYSITETPISAMFQTKVFDFDYPERRKNIRRLYIGATDTADGYIRLAYITEQGTREDALRLGDYGSGEMRQWMVTPGVNRVRQFGLKAESNGYMAVDNLVIKYEVNGEVR